MLVHGAEEKAMWNIAERAALHEVEAFIAHDRHDYKSTEENFYQSLRLMLRCHKDSTLKKVAKEKTEVLRCHDEIEESNIARSAKLEHPAWFHKVLRHAKNEAELLGINTAYALNKVQFYRLHGQGVTKFRHYVYEMDKHFTTGITEDPRLYLITAPIYLACVALHDRRRMLGQREHDGFTKRMMQMSYATYVFNLLHAVKDKRKILDNLNRKII